MIRTLFKRVDPKFFIIFIIGIILRILSSTHLPVSPDSLYYIECANTIIAGNYVGSRPPVFPLFIVPFILIFKDEIIAVKLTSFTFGLLTIITSYIVFTKLSLKIFKNDENGEIKSKYIGLVVSFFISIHYYTVFNNGRGLREEAMSFLYLLFFYYIFLDENKKSMKNSIIIILVVSLITLIHSTAGLFLTIAIVLFFIASKLKNFNFKISTKKLLIVITSFSCSFSFWLIFCAIQFGDPFYTYSINRRNWETITDIELDSIEGYINAFFNGLTIGIGFELNYVMFLSIGRIFTFIIIFVMIYHYKIEYFFFLSILIVINFLYLSAFMAYVPNIRFVLYLLPFLYFFGMYYIIDIWYNNKEKKLVKFKFLRRKFCLSYNSLFFLYLIIFSVSQGFYLIFHITKEAIYGYSYTNLKIIEDLILIFMIIIPHYGKTNKNEVLN